MKSKQKFKETEIGKTPEEWEIRSVKDIAEVFLGGTPKTNVKEYWNGKIKWASARDVSNCNSRYIYETEKTITEEGIRNSAAKILPKDTVVITSRGTVGKLVLLPESMSFNQTCYGLKAKEEINPLFLYYKLKSLVINLKSISYGTVFSTITMRTFDELKIAIPPLTEEQNTIANILSKLDDKIELNQQMNKTLEAIGQAIFKHWFVDFEFPNENDKPYKSSGGEMVYNEDLGEEIPRGWRVGYLGDNILTTISKPGIDKFEGEKIYLDTSSVQNSTIINLDNKITFKQRPSRANMQPRPKTVWFAKMKESKKILFFDDYSKYGLNNFVLSTGFAGLDVKDYALCYVLSFILRDRFEIEKDNLCHGTTMQAINNENIMRIRILIPHKGILEKFDPLVKNIYEKISQYWVQNIILSQIRDSLLPKLMSGKIRVLLR